MKRLCKGFFGLLAILIFVSNFLAACETAPQQTIALQPSGVVVGHCSPTFQPVLTHITAPHPSSHVIYFVSGIHLYALNAGDGKLLWCMYATHAGTHLSVQGDIATALFRDGPPPQPDGFTGLTLSNGIIYATSMNGYIYAFLASSGMILWKQNTGFANTSAPVVVANTVYVGSGTIYALNAHDGSIRWRYPTTDVVTSSPVIVNGVLYAGSYGARVYALNAATGVRLWEYETGGRVYVDPAVGDRMVFFGAGDDRWTLAAVDAGNGKLLWHGMSVESSLVVSNGALYAGSANFLYRLNVHNGAILWRYPVATPFNPMVAHGVLYVASGSSGMDAFDMGGKLLWHNALNPMRVGTTSKPVLIANEVYIETMDEGVSPSNALLHALNARSGAEDWSAKIPWNVGTIGIAG